MKILITGGAGFIGSHIADSYVAAGHEVAVFDNLTKGLEANLNPAVRLYRGDVANLEDVTQCFNDFEPEVVSHHAAQVDVPRALYDPAYDASVNVLGSLHVLTNSLKAGVKRFIFASSSAVYGEPNTIPVSEQHTLAPTSPYGIGKLAFEQYLQVEPSLAAFQTTIFRYANVYGPRQGAHGESGVISIFTKSLLQNKPCTIFGDGTTTRDYIFVSDVVEANQAALSLQEDAIINIGSGQETSTRQVFEVARQFCSDNSSPLIEAEPRAGDVSRSCLRVERAARILSWQPKVDFETGVRLTLEWQKSQNSAN